MSSSVGEFFLIILKTKSLSHRSILPVVAGLWAGGRGLGGGGSGGGGGPAPGADLLPAEEHAGHGGAGPAEAPAAQRHVPEAGRQRARGHAPRHRLPVRLGGSETQEGFSRATHC